MTKREQNIFSAGFCAGWLAGKTGIDDGFQESHDRALSVAFVMDPQIHLNPEDK